MPERKEAVIGLRASMDEKAQWEASATRQGLTLQAWLRFAAHEKTARDASQPLGAKAVWDVPPIPRPPSDYEKRVEAYRQQDEELGFTVKP